MTQTTQQRAAIHAGRIAAALPSRSISDGTKALWAETFMHFPDDVAAKIAAEFSNNLRAGMDTPSPKDIRVRLEREMQSRNTPRLGGTVAPVGTQERLCETCGEVMLLDVVASDKDRAIWFHATAPTNLSFRAWMASDFHAAHDPTRACWHCKHPQIGKVLDRAKVGGKA